MASFPRYVALATDPRLQTANYSEIHPEIDKYGDPVYSYARYVVEEGETHGRITVARQIRGVPSDDDEEGIHSPFARFELVRARFQADRFHIKCLFNNKYLRAASESVPNRWVVAAADAPEEDESKWNCTMVRFFRIATANPNPPFHRYSMHMGFRQVDFERDSNFLTNNRVPWTGGLAFWNYFIIEDLERLTRLPRFIAFVGDNGNYLTHTTGDRVANVQVFGTEKREDEEREIPIDFPLLHYEVFTARNGNVRIKSISPDRYLEMRTSPWITATADEAALTNPSRRGNAVFAPYRLHTDGKAMIHLKHLGSNTYCRRFSNIVTHGLAANGTNAERSSRIKVVEIIRAREVYNVFFRAAESIIREPAPVSIVTKEVANYSPVSTQTTQLSFSYTEFKSNTYRGSHSWGVGINYTSTISARLPILRFIQASVTLEIDASYEGSHEWETVEEESSQLETRFVVTVTPSTTSRVGMVVSKARVVVPFSYTQRDTLFDWTIREAVMHDGIFEGESTYINFDVVDQPIGQQLTTTTTTKTLGTDILASPRSGEDVADQAIKLPTTTTTPPLTEILPPTGSGDQNVVDQAVELPTTATTTLGEILPLTGSGETIELPIATMTPVEIVSSVGSGDDVVDQVVKVPETTAMGLTEIPPSTESEDQHVVDHQAVQLPTTTTTTTTTTLDEMPPLAGSGDTIELPK